MSDKLVVSWVINSLNQESQRIHRKIDDQPEELLQVLGPLDTTYLDDTATGIAVDQVTYRIESVASFRGFEVVESSESQTYIIEKPVDFSKASIFTVGSGDAQVYAAHPFMVVNTADETKIESTVYPNQSGYYSLTVNQPGDYGIITPDMQLPLTGVMLSGAITSLNTWHSAGYLPSTLGESVLSVSFTDSMIESVPDHLHESITTTADMFAGCASFNQDISGWNVANVTDMSNMFNGATSFNQDLSMWCVGGVTSLPTNFSTNAPLLTEDRYPVWGTCPRGENIPANEVHFVTNGVAYYQGIAGDEIVYSDGTTLPITTNQRVTLKSITGTQKVVLKSDRGTSALSKVICFEGSGITELLNFPKSSEINGCKFYIANGSANLVKVPTTLPPNITDLSRMFQKCGSFNQDISGWDTSKVTNMTGMFQFATNFNQPLNTWNTSNVTSMNSVFNGASAFNGAIDQWDTSKVTTMGQMFQNATLFNVDISSWNTALVDYMGYMFYGANAFSYSLRDWCVPLITSEPSAFGNGSSTFGVPKYPVWGTCPRGEIYGDDYSTYVLREGYFISNPGAKLTLGNGEVVEIPNNNNLGYLVKDNQVGNASLVGNNAEYVARGSALVKVLTYPKNATSINHQLSTNLIEVPDTLPSKVTSLEFAFDRCGSFNQDISGWDTSNVVNMSNMFYNCSAFNQPLNTWNTSKVTDMSYMFRSCSAFNQPLDTWDVGNVTNMSSMFNSAFRFNQPLNNWNVSNVTDMYGMFTGCQVFDQPLNNWNVSKVINMNSMFDLCNAFGQDLSQWCVPLITNPPTGFNNSAPNLTEDKHPVWGTCPRGEV